MPRTNTWILALKEYNKGKVWKIPTKGSKEYNEVKANSVSGGFHSKYSQKLPKEYSQVLDQIKEMEQFKISLGRNPQVPVNTLSLFRHKYQVLAASENHLRKIVNRYNKERGKIIQYMNANLYIPPPAQDWSNIPGIS